MPCEGAITFRDLVGKLTVLRITCDKCGRSRQYRLERLIMRYGIDAKLFDCPTRSRQTAHGSRPRIWTTNAAPGAQTCQKWCSLPNSVSEYFFRSRRASSVDSWTFDQISSLSASLAKASSSWIASFSEFLGQCKKGRFQLWSAGGRGQFGTARRVHTAFFGVVWHRSAPCGN
jgi:hypothetical protein